MLGTGTVNPPPRRYSFKSNAVRPTAVEIAPRVIELRNLGMGISQLAERFHVSYSLVHKMLRKAKLKTSNRKNREEKKEPAAPKARRTP
jgi:DNA invertase Pin-like site-specific DNA recombinase